MRIFTTIFPALIIALISAGDVTAQNEREEDIHAINTAVADWDHAWEIKDVELAVKHYADRTDWTNAFGARVKSKDELHQLLEMIFGFDFVMTGRNHYGENEITFVNDDIATVRSQNIRKGQKWPDGTLMEDRIINHLRVFKRTESRWLITDHMISQAWPRELDRDLIDDK